MTVPTELAADQHRWDSHPHDVYDGVPVDAVRISDVIAQCLQVTGIAAAEHRGKRAYRFDVENVATGGKGRMVLTLGQAVSDVKRYRDPSDPTEYPSAATLAERSPKPTDNTWDAIVASYIAGHGGYDDDLGALFGLICDATREYARRGGDGDTPRENAWTLSSVLANVAPGYTITDNQIVSAPNVSVD